jgi:hypothetical protein
VPRWPATTWQQQLALLAPATRARAEQLTALVVGGQGKAIAALAGPQAQVAALGSFVHGVRGAMLVGSALTLLAAAVAFFGLRRFAPAPSVEPAAEAVGVPGADSAAEQQVEAGHGQRLAQPARLPDPDHAGVGGPVAGPWAPAQPRPALLQDRAARNS